MNDIKLYTRNETSDMLDALKKVINKCIDNGLIYKHEWNYGDLIITDNLGLIHEADKSTQYSLNKIGLRVMQRISIEGLHVPCKM